MFAIEITEGNLETIKSAHFIPEKIYAGLQLFIKSKSTWYIATGYVTDKGALQDYAIFPAHVFNRRFNYNETKIKTEWDMIVQS